jgi:hypothetical protein
MIESDAFYLCRAQTLFKPKDIPYIRLGEFLIHLLRRLFYYPASSIRAMPVTMCGERRLAEPLNAVCNALPCNSVSLCFSPLGDFGLLFFDPDIQNGQYYSGLIFCIQGRATGKIARYDRSNTRF